MTFINLLWTLTIGWFISCLFYTYKIFSVAKASGYPVSALISKGKRSSNTFVRKLFINILIATACFIGTLIIAFVIAFSS